MKTVTLTHEITGRMLLPLGIMAFAMIIIPPTAFIIPATRHLFSQISFEYYLITGIVSGIFVLCCFIAEKTK